MTFDDQTSHLAGAGSSWPDLDTLADYHAGALDPDTAARVADHVRTDPEAQRVLAALDATVASLRSLPPVAVPEFVARRIDNALSYEARSYEASAGEVGHPAGFPEPGNGPRPFAAPRYAPAAQPTAPVIDLDHARLKRARQTRLLSVIAAGLIVVGGGAYAATQLGSSSTSDVAGGASSTSQAAAATSTTTTYDSTTITSAAPDVLAFGKITDGKADAGAAGKMAEVFERNKCLLLLSGTVATQPDGGPLAVQQIIYEGQAAYAFVFPTANSETVRLVVVAADKCSEVLDDVQAPAKG